MMPDWIDTDSFLFGLLWQTTAWLSIGMIGAVLFRRHPARAHGVLMSCIIAALITPALSSMFKSLGWGLLHPPTGASGIELASVPLTGATPAPYDEWLTFSTMFGIVWLTLSLFMLLRLGRSLLAGRHLLLNTRRLEHPALMKAVQHAANRLGLEVEPEILESDTVRCPVIWCWGRVPRIVLPIGMLEHDPGDLDAVLCHELAHSKRRDHLAAMAVEVAACLLAWHPLMWPARKRAEDLAEQSCDAWVLSTGASPANYADALLTLIPQHSATLALPAVHGHHGLARRIVRILDDYPCHPRLGRMFTLITLTLLIGLASTTALAQRRPLEVPLTNTVRDSHESPGNKTPGTFTIDASRPFLMEVSPLELDLGMADVDEVKSGSIWLINRGAQPLTILGTKASCGCTTVENIENTILQPGEAKQVEINMVASGAPGSRKTKHVTFYFKEQSPLKIPVHATIRDAVP